MASSRSSVPAPREPGPDAARPSIEDVLLPHAPTEDGAGFHVLRKRGDAIEAGVVRAMRDGQPLHGELVKLAPREGTPLFDVEVLHDARSHTSPAREQGLGRPARVASARFREGWDRIWGDPAERDEEPS
jgi:hypothetical protein